MDRAGGRHDPAGGRHGERSRAAASAPRESPRRRVAFAAALAASMGIGPFAVNAVGAMSPLVVPDLGLTRTELGSLATVTFAVAATTSILGGRQVDAFRARRVTVAVFVVGGAAAATMASAAALPWLWAGAALAGVTQAIANPVTNQLISDHVPPGHQGMYVGVKQSGVQMGQALIGFALPSLALVVGWRGSMSVGIVLAVLGMVAVRLVLPASPAHGRAHPDAARARLEPMVWWLAAYTCLISMAVQAVMIFVPLYAFERVGLSAQFAGMATGVLGATGIVARIAWTRAAERLDAPVRTLMVLAAMACGSVLLIAAGEHVGPWTLWLGLVGFGVSAVAVNAVVMLTVVRGAAQGRTGRASGVVGLGLYGGFMVGPLAFGPLVDRTGSYLLGWSIAAGLCALAVGLTMAWWHTTHVPADPTSATGS